VDLDGDGRLDVVTTASDDTSGALGVLRGKPDGTLAAKVEFPIARRPSSLVIADANGDGRLDAMMLDLDKNVLSVLAGNGDATFQPRLDYQTRAAPSSLTAADFNRDGRLDFAMTHFGFGAGKVGVLFGRCIR
jgi:hypothetical protein